MSVSRSFLALATALTALVAPLAPAVAEPARPTADGAARLAPVGGAPLRAAELRLGGERLGARLRTSTYRMLAVTWRGADPTAVRVRTRGVRSGWSAWRELEVLEDGPSAAAGEGNGRRGTDLAWVGRSDGVQVRAAGRGYDDLELVLVDPRRVAADTGQQTLSRTATAESGATSAPAPSWRIRADWGANEKWRDGAPRYNSTIKQVHVHHTASSNSYSRADVPGLIRSMYYYHTHSLGWSDLGYNFLIDKFGRIWVGRSGGPRKPVRGAHTLGFNGSSTGVALIGNHQSTEPRREARVALIRLAAYKLDKYNRNPRAKIRVWSEGSDKYPRGSRPWLRVIDGHRDTNHTACPGWRLYKRLPDIREYAYRRAERFG